MLRAFSTFNIMCEWLQCKVYIVYFNYRIVSPMFSSSFKDIFGSFFLRNVLRSCLNDFKPRECGFESYRRLNLLFSYFAIFLKIHLSSGLKCKGCLVKCLVKKKANQLDFRQIHCTSGFLYELISKI